MMEQVHVYFLHFASTLAMIAVRTGCHHICPDVLAAHVARHHVIHRQAAIPLSAVLAGIIIAAKNFAACQFDVWARPMNLVLQSNDGRTGQQLFDRSNVSSPVDDHVCFARQEQADCPSRGTNIDRFKIGV